jgi:hypothetical protein
MLKLKISISYIFHTSVSVYLAFGPEMTKIAVCDNISAFISSLLLYKDCKYKILKFKAFSVFSLQQ